MDIDGPCGPPDVGDGPPERGHSAESADRNVSPQNPPETRSRHQYYGELVSARPYEIATFASLVAAIASVERSEGQAPLSRGEVDRCGRGVIDERGKRFSPAERRIAEYLAGHGSAVVSVYLKATAFTGYPRCARQRHTRRVQEPRSRSE